MSMPPNYFELFDSSCIGSRNPEGKDLSLLKREEVVPYQISNGSYDDNYEKHYEACMVVHYRGEGKYYRNPIDNIVSHKNQV